MPTEAGNSEKEKLIKDVQQWFKEVEQLAAKGKELTDPRQMKQIATQIVFNPDIIHL